MSRNSRNKNGRNMYRNTGRNLQTGPLAAAAGISGKTVKEAVYRKAGTAPGMWYNTRSHYATAGAASLPRRAGRRY